MTIIIDPQNSGISGNMFIGALVDLGADSEEIKKITERVAKDFGKITTNISKVNKHGIEASFCNIEIEKTEGSITYKELINRIDSLKDKYSIDEELINRSKNVFKRLGLAESKIHGKPLNDIHFHEVGTADAVADIIGTIYGFYSLGLNKENVIGLPVALGGGLINSSHGYIPVPAPATIEILKGATCIGGPVNDELTTPTGASLYMELCDEFSEFLPMINIDEIGYGAGSKEFNHPNVLRIIRGKSTMKIGRINVLETNIDHLSGEKLGYIFDKLLKEGARDVSIIPIIMKKNRPGHLIKVLVKNDNMEHILNIMFKELGTLGIRISKETHRGVAEREIIKLKLNISNEEYTVNFKIGKLDGEIISKRPEYEDIKKIADETNLSLNEVENIGNYKITEYLNK